MKRSLPTSAPSLLAATLKKKCCTLSALLLWSLLLSLTGGLVAQDLIWAKQISGTSYERPRSVAVDADGNVYTTGVFYGTVDFDPGPGTFNLIGSVSPVGDLRPDIFVSKLDASGNFVWAKRMGGTGLSGAAGTSIAVDGSNVYITGFFSGTVDFDPGPGTFNLTPISNTGNPFVVNRDIYVCKLDAASGNLVWVKSMGGQDALIDSESITVDDSGNVYTTGSFDGGTVDFDPGVDTYNLTNMVSRSMFVHKLDASGNFLWVKSMGGDFNQGRSVAVDGSGNVYTTGYFSRTGDFDPGPGTFNLVTNYKLDIFVSKLDASGNFVWAKNMGSPWDDEGVAIAVDDLGNVYTTGTFTNTADFDPGPNTFYLTSNGAVPTQYDDIFISKLDASGNFVWAKKIGDTGRFDYPSAIAVDGSGNVYTTGAFENTVDFDPGPGVFNLTQTGLSNIFISMLDASGNFLAAKRMGGNDFAFSNSLVLDGPGNIYLTGSFRETIDLDPDGCTSTLLTSAGNDDIFVVKMRPPLSPPTTTGASVACGGPVVTGLTATCTDDCTPTWWNAPVGGTQQGADNESPFDPTGWAAEEGAVDLNTPGTYTFYAQCECQGCFSPRAAAVLTVESCCAGPTVNCPASTVVAELNQNGIHTFDYGATLISFTADCGLQSIVFSEDEFSCADVGIVPVTVTLTDINGATATCTINVDVQDNLDPKITCPANITVNNDVDECGAIISFNISATDNCPGVTWGSSDQSGDQFPVGTTNVNATATDAHSNTDDCSFTVTVIDNQDPAISCPGNITVNNDEGDCGALVSVPIPTASDNCGVTALDFRYIEVDPDTDTEIDDTWSSWTTETSVPLAVGKWKVRWRAKDASNNKKTCNFFITVLDNEDPTLVRPCPANITGLCGAQSVSWDPPTAKDNCAVVSTVSNYDPDDAFPVGTTTVTYTFKDAADKSVSCSFDIVIHADPAVTISQEDLPTWCQGIKVLTANVLNPQALTYPLTFAWSDGLGDSPTVIAPANGTYSVVVTDALGCSTEVSTTVNVDISTLLSAYTIISGKGLEMYESDVLGGGVGVKNANECVISQNSSILTFMRANAAGVTVDGSSFVNNFINANFNVTLPAFLSNPYNAFNNINVPANATVTLSGSNYGYVTVGAGATLIIANAQIFIKNLVTQKDATIIFNQPTEMRIRRKMSIGETNTVNPDGYTSVIYASDVVSIGQGSVVTLSIYAPEGLNVSDSGASLTTYMTGIFISNDEVASDHHVIWNWNLNCSYLPTTGGGNIPFAASPDQEVIETSITTKEGLNVYPNPTSGLVNIYIKDFLGQKVEYTVYDSFGKEVMRSTIDQLEIPTISLDMSSAQFANGMYQVSLKGNTEMKTARFVLSK